MVHRLSKSLIAFTIAFLAPSSVLGQYYEPVVRPLGSKYRVHKTRHFEIIFEEGSEVEAWQTALILERTLPEAQSLSGLAGKMWMPVVLNNSSDRANGYVHTHPFRQEIEVPHIKGNRIGTRSHSWIGTRHTSAGKRAMGGGKGPSLVCPRCCARIESVFAARPE